MTTFAMRTRDTTVHSTPISTPLERSVHPATLDGVVHAAPLDRTTALFEGIPPRAHRYYRRSKLLHPQWMRTLEEKYQRLHMKITRSTSSMKQMYNSAIGRAVIDQRICRANLNNKTIRDQGVKDTILKRNNKICAVLKPDFDRKKEEEIEEEYADSCEDEEGSDCDDLEEKARNLADDIRDEEIRSNIESVKSECEDFRRDECLSEVCSVTETRSQNDRIDRVDSNNNYENGAERPNDKEPELMNGIKIGNSQGHNVTCDKNMNARSGKKAGLRSNKKNVNIIENVEHMKNSRNKRAADQTNPKVIKADQTDSFITQLANHMNSNHSLPFRAKTSNSKISTVTQKTSKSCKSCPATMDNKQTPVQSKLNTVKSVPTLRAKTAGSRTKHPVKVFSRMSQEAQHAMSETMKEKSIPKTPEPEVQDYAEEKVIWEIGRPSIEEKLAATPRLENRKNRSSRIGEDVYGSHCEIEDIIQDDAYSDTDVSMQTSRRRPISTKTNRTRLPFIPAESPSEYYTLGQLKHLNYRLPGIGKYEIATLREKTFEITPPGYDIRYNDIAVFEEGEMMELPSSDIRDRAVQKCNEWLSRYTPRYSTVQTASLKDAS